MLVAHESKAEVSKSRRTHPPETRQLPLFALGVNSSRLEEPWEGNVHFAAPLRLWETPALDSRQHALLGGAVVKGGVRNLVFRYRSGRIDGEQIGSAHVWTP